MEGRVFMANGWALAMARVRAAGWRGLPGWPGLAGLLAAFTLLVSSLSAPGAAAAMPVPALTLMRLAWSSEPAAVSLMFLHGDVSGVGFKARVEGRRLIVVLPSVRAGTAGMRPSGVHSLSGVWWAQGYAVLRRPSGLTLEVRLTAPLDVHLVRMAGGSLVAVVLGVSPSAVRTAKHGFGTVPVAPLAVPEEPDTAHTALAVSVMRASYGATPAPLAQAPQRVMVSLPRVARGAGKKWRAYALVLGPSKILYLPAPAGSSTRAGVGADGSFSVTVSTKDQGTLQVFSDSACVGCAMDGAAFWFPILDRQAVAYGVHPGAQAASLGALIGLRTTRPRLVTYAFHTRQGQVVVGFAAAPMSHAAFGQGVIGLAFFGSWMGPSSDVAQGTAELHAAEAAMGGTWASAG